MVDCSCEVGEGACQYCQCMQLRVCNVRIAAHYHYSGNEDCWKQNLVMVEWDILFYVDKKTESFSVNLKPLCQDLSKILCAAREVLLRLTNLKYLFIFLMIKQKYEDNASPRVVAKINSSELFNSIIRISLPKEGGNPSAPAHMLTECIHILSIDTL